MRFRGYALRKGRCAIPGCCYLVTAVTLNRFPAFRDHRHARIAARAFYADSVQIHGQTLAYVVMPDHIHWLLRLKGSLSEAVRLYKSTVSVRIACPLWQRGFHDHALRQEEDLLAAARYIVANPVRANLVQSVGEYPYWNAVWL
jgi:REP element-mobilizing transposase RayT